ncbi:hypothetical protein SODG_005810 [Sodalis praecaptivus]|uniref:CSS-motif domain-containing protein n=1 Tax=Sodalis praecaptivus TaxID=1239307 RepID=UPI0027E86C9B|nr:CSS-motif domain-containing protein [Sodalis praecaptivus]CAJ0997320.1 hypothetical protein NVIRENTERO_02804 [Sodalis praecaptivus]
MRRILATAMLAKVMNNNHFILWGIIPLLFFIFSLVLLLFITQQNMKSQVRQDIHALIDFIDTVLGNGDETAQRALLLAGRPCPVVEALRDLGRQYPLNTLGQFGGPKRPLLFAGADGRDERCAGAYARRRERGGA